MRRFAEIVDGAVARVIVATSAEWCADNLGGVWVETFTDGTRKHRAAKGYTYDEGRDAFIPPKPFDSWVLDEATCLWEAPIAMPADGAEYSWDEEVGDWVEIQEPVA